MNDPLIIGGHQFNSRFILGSGKFSLDMTRTVIENGGVQMATLALRRANAGGRENILDYIPEGITLLPNTSGARNADEAVRIARLSRELGCGDFVKVEIIHDSKYLLPDNFETVKATEILAKEGFIVMPYMMPDLAAARALQNAGAAAIMPLGAPIGSNKGLLTRDFVKILAEEIDLPIIVDAGIGRPRHVKQWNWVLPPSWLTLPSLLQAMLPPWPAPLSLPLRQAASPTYQSRAAFLKTEAVLQARSPAFWQIKEAL